MGTPGTESPYSYTKADFTHKPLMPKHEVDRGIKKIKISTTKWIRDLIDDVQAQERGKGRRVTKAFVTRRLIEMGARRYDELGELPVRDP